MDQIKKANVFKQLHHGDKLLILPNIWDPIGALLLQKLELPAVATASAAVSYSLGYPDGQRIPFPRMLSVIQEIANAVDIPLTVDIEGGYAESPHELAEHVRQVIHAGAVGINFEDSDHNGTGLHEIAFQCQRLAAIRKMAEQENLPLVINARIDTFERQTGDSRPKLVAQTIERGRAYRDAGADCLYPMGPGDVETLQEIQQQTAMPINVYAGEHTASMTDLEAAGIRRFSLGPGLLKTSLMAIKTVAEALKGYGSYERFTRDAMTSEEIRKLVR